MSSQVHKVALIPSDGIGNEVVPAAKRVLDEVAPLLSVPFEYSTLEAGWGTFQKTGNALPEETVSALRSCHGAIFGAVSSPSHAVEGYQSPIVAMRKHLDLYANLRPCASAPIAAARQGVDMLIVRENTECLYVKSERLETDESGKPVRAVADRIITAAASERIARMAFEQARQRAERPGAKDPLVTIVHKANVVRVSDGLFRETALAVAQEYPDIPYEEQLVDSMVYKMILDPTKYDVVVAPNLYGDILSDGAAAIVGGLGLVPSANVGSDFCMVEPVHGSAPDIEGKGIANPLATISASALLLGRLPHFDAAESAKYANAIQAAVTDTLLQGEVLTPDMGGTGTTEAVTDAVISNLKQHL